ncbi:MAG: DUF4288 domain-containing protein [Planctomycetaceae bacterium]|nr:DUF4288 domain-containing protein [Planctomycetota bacterium]NUN52610.1 DUF4288 domain-containing protein [Planctomycetaceae bacterium]
MGGRDPAKGGGPRTGGWSWWTARILVRCRCDDPADGNDTWDHVMLLVRARNGGEAARTAAAKAREQDTEYSGGTGYRVRWRFERLLEVHETGEVDLVSGVEIHSLLGTGRGRKRPEDPLAAWSAFRRRSLASRRK